jgi:hypothetical protein
MKHFYLSILQISLIIFAACKQNKTEIKSNPASIITESQSCPEPFVFPPVDSTRIFINTTEDGAGIKNDVFNVPISLCVDKYNFNFCKYGKNLDSIRFVNVDGSPLPFTIEQWDDSLRKATFRVLIDTVYGNQSEQFFFMLQGSVSYIPLSADSIVLIEALEKNRMLKYRNSHLFYPTNDTIPQSDEAWLRLTYPEWGDGYSIISSQPIMHCKPVLSITSSTDKVGENCNSMAEFRLITQLQMPLNSNMSFIARLKISGSALPGEEYEYLPSISSVNISAGECSTKKAIPLTTHNITGPEKTVTITIQPDDAYITGNNCTQTITIMGK